MRGLALALLSLPLAAQAEPQPAVAALMHYTDNVATCLDDTVTVEQAEACIGFASKTCMDTEEGGFSTTGMMFCTLAEYEAWDVELNRAYRRAMEDLRKMDAQEAEAFPEFADRADSLRTAQRAWIPLRDGDCALEYAMWGSGSMRQIAGASCLLDKTAERTIYLRFLGRDMQ